MKVWPADFLSLRFHLFSGKLSLLVLDYRSVFRPLCNICDGTSTSVILTIIWCYCYILNDFLMFFFLSFRAICCYRRERLAEAQIPPLKSDIKKKKKIRRVSRPKLYVKEFYAWTSHVASLSANPTRLSNTLKQFVNCCWRIVWVRLTILWVWRLKG